MDRGRTPDRALVDVDHLVEVLQPGDRLVAAGDVAGAVELVGEDVVEDVVDQRRLAGPGHPGDRDQRPQRERHGDVLEVVLARADDGDHLAVARSSDRRDRDLATAGEVLPRDRVGVREEAGDRSRVDHLAAVLAGARADVDDPVGGRDGVLVVLDDDEGVAEVAQPGQRLDEPVVVALVQADRGLVENVEDADQPGPDLGRQPDALRLAAGQRAGGPVQRQVVEADVEQEPQPGLDLLDDPLGDLPLAHREVDVGQELGRLVDGQRADLGDVLAADEDGEDLRLEPGTLALRARHLAHVALVALAAPVGVGLGVPSLDERDDALEPGRVGPVAAVAVAVLHVDLVVLAVEQRFRGPLGQRLPRRVHREAQVFAERGDDPQEVVGRAGPLRPGRDGALAERQVVVGNDQLRVDLELGADPGAARAGAVGRVERERPRLDLVDGDRVVVGAGHLLREPTLSRQRRVASSAGTSTNSMSSTAAGEAQRGLDRVGQPPLRPGVAALGRPAGRRRPRWCA